MRCFVVVTALFLASQAHAGELKAGAAMSNVTPRLGSSINGNMTDVTARHVHDELHARCLVLDDGKGKVAIAVVDACAVDRSIVLAAKGLVETELGIRPGRVLISATHSHSCGTTTRLFQSSPDPEYQRFLARRIADGIVRANNNLVPAKLGYGEGKNDRQVFNRRWFMKPGGIGPDPFGKRNDTVKMNPGHGNPYNDRPAGPTDPSIPVVSVRTADGKPLALLANYSLHYVGGVGPGHLSADYFGAFADRIQQLLKADRQDPPFVAMMSNGTSGDINNVNYAGKPIPAPPYGRIKQVADDVADEAVKAVGSITYSDAITLDGRDAILTLGVRKADAAELRRAKDLLAKRQGQPLRNLEEFYAGETVAMAGYPDTVEVPVQALRIGDIAIAAIPCEVFVEIGLELKARSPIKPMFTIELANGYNGYLPTPEQHKRGGYETWRAKSSYLEVDASTKIQTKVLELLGELKSAR